MASLRTDVPKNICIRKFNLQPFIRDNSGHHRWQVVYIYSNASLPFYLYRKTKHDRDRKIDREKEETVPEQLNIAAR